MQSSFQRMGERECGNHFKEVQHPIVNFNEIAFVFQHAEANFNLFSQLFLFKINVMMKTQGTERELAEQLLLQNHSIFNRQA